MCLLAICTSELISERSTAQTEFAPALRSDSRTTSVPSLGTREGRALPPHAQPEMPAAKANRRPAGCSEPVRSVPCDVQPRTPHEALDLDVPASRYRVSPRSFPSACPSTNTRRDSKPAARTASASSASAVAVSRPARHSPTTRSAWLQRANQPSSRSTTAASPSASLTSTTHVPELQPGTDQTEIQTPKRHPCPRPCVTHVSGLYISPAHRISLWAPLGRLIRVVVEEALDGLDSLLCDPKQDGKDHDPRRK